MANVKLFDISWELHDIDSFNQLFLEQVERKTKLCVSSINLHAIYCYYKFPEMKLFIDSSAAHIDGMPIIWMLKLRGFKFVKSYHRITWVDWMLPLLSFCQEKNLKVFYLGGKPGVAKEAMKNVAIKIPELNYNVRDGYFNMAPTDNPENLSVIDTINNYNPNILIVGMGMGRQEKWLYENRDKINANVLITCGAAAEYFSGIVKTPPRWMGTAGLEWLYRLMENPQRFAFRYIVEPWFILKLYFKKYR